MTRRRLSLSDLAAKVRLAEPGGYNLAADLAVAPELGVELGVSANDVERLAALGDDELAPELGELLARRSAMARAARCELVHQRVAAAAHRLAVTATWADCGVVINAAALLGDLLADGGTRHVTVCVEDAFEVTLPRVLLTRVASVVGSWSGLRAYLDADGLHFRWRNGRGGLDLRSQQVPVREREGLLVVVLRPQRPAEAQGRPQGPSRAALGWVHDVLAEVGFNLSAREGTS